MNLYNKVRAVNKVLKEVDEHISSFKKESGLSCVANCGLCCFNPEVFATPLEFLPVAYKLFIEGKAEKYYESIHQNKEVTICSFSKKFIIEGDTGFCGVYENRGMICRLFGFSAQKDKTGNLNLIACKSIKDTNDTSLLKFRQGNVPVSADYYFKLRNIDPILGNRLLPINQAIIGALEEVLQYYMYRKRPRNSA